MQLLLYINQNNHDLNVHLQFHDVIQFQFYYLNDVINQIHLHYLLYDLNLILMIVVVDVVIDIFLTNLILMLQFVVFGLLYHLFLVINVHLMNHYQYTILDLQHQIWLLIVNIDVNIVPVLNNLMGNIIYLNVLILLLMLVLGMMYLDHYHHLNVQRLMMLIIFFSSQLLIKM